jgi:hypothetical protein
MTDKKDRERVIAEITLSHLIRLGNEQGCPVSRQQALAFLNQEGRAFEMWKHMMQAVEDFIAGSFAPAFLALRSTQRIRVWASPRAVDQHRLALATSIPSAACSPRNEQARKAQCCGGLLNGIPK